MNQETEERIKIIRQFKPTLHYKDQSLEGRIKKLRYYGILKYFLANFFLIITMIRSAIVLLSMDDSGQNWQKAGLMIFIALSLSLHAHYSYIEFLLLKHVRNLQNHDYTISFNSNKELQVLINRLNYHRFQPYWIIIPSIIVMIASILSIFELNPFWLIFALPVLIVSVLLSWRLNNDVLHIRNNIHNLESTFVLDRIK